MLLPELALQQPTSVIKDKKQIPTKGRVLIIRKRPKVLCLAQQRVTRRRCQIEAKGDCQPCTNLVRFRSDQVDSRWTLLVRCFRDIRGPKSLAVSALLQASPGLCDNMAGQPLEKVLRDIDRRPCAQLSLDGRQQPMGRLCRYQQTPREGYLVAESERTKNLTIKEKNLNV